MDILKKLEQTIKSLPSNEEMDGSAEITFEYVVSSFSDITLPGVELSISASPNNNLKIETNRLGNCFWTIGQPLNKQSKQTITFLHKLIYKNKPLKK